MSRPVLALFIIALLVIGSSAGYLLLQQPSSSSSCFQLEGLTKTQLSESGFGAVTKFQLPSPSRWPNAIAVAADGSIWFGEDAIPGLAHFYPANGTLVEYPFPGNYEPSASNGHTCSDKTDIWGIAIWDGRIWATDSVKNRLLGLDPAKDEYTSVALPGNYTFPYTLTPIGDQLWFAQILSNEVGSLSASGTVKEYPITTQTSYGAIPASTAQVAFANATLGYYADLGAVVNGSIIYDFNPQNFSPTPVPGQGNETLFSPDSISLCDGGAWVSEHGASDVAYFNMSDSRWTLYPTSWINYTEITLPYFVECSGQSVWFNEHYANRMAVLDPGNGSLTEYSLEDPPVGELFHIDNALTFAVGENAVWFTEFTSNAIGFVNPAYNPGFTVQANESALSAKPGQTINLTATITGESTNPLSIMFSDSEGPNSKPVNITIDSNVTEFPSLNGNEEVQVSINVPQGLRGDYVLLITATNGLVYKSVAVRLHVEG
jgi:streptogramin lyase